MIGPTAQVRLRGSIQVRCVDKAVGPESSVQTPERTDRKHMVLGL